MEVMKKTDCGGDLFFSELTVGDVVEYGNDCFIVLPIFTTADKGQTFNAFNVDTKQFALFMPSTVVKRKNAILSIS